MTSSQDYFTPPCESSPSQEVSRSAASRPPVLNKCIRRPRLDRKMIANLLARRYGSLTDFSKVVARYCDISRATGLHRATVRNAIKLFHKRGDRYERCRDNVRPVGRPRVIPEDLEAQLTSYETLNDMKFLSIPRRVEIIRREFNWTLGEKTLRMIYKRNGVTNR